MSANPFLQARITSKNFNLRQHHLSPISSTFYNFEDTSSIGTVNSSSKASTSPTPLERKIISLRPMASPPSKTLHTILLIYPVPPLSPPLDTFLIAWLYEIGKHLARQRTAEMVAAIMTKSPLAPALVRQQMAKRVAVIMTTRPMPALARHQMAEDSAIIALAIIMTTHSMPALARNQMA